MTGIQLVNYSTVELIKTNASDEDVARAAWVSNFAEDARTKDAEKIVGLINFLYREQHTSPFEHGSFTFFVDCPIFVTREYHRHRTWSYNETSGRYKILEPRFYIPPPERPLVQTGKIGAYRHEPGTQEQIDWILENHGHAYRKSWDIYLEGMEMGIAKEVARNVLPVGIMTQFYATANPLNVLKFFILRSDEQALWEIRYVSKLEETMVKEAMPLTYEAFDKQRDAWRRIKAILAVMSLDDLEKRVGHA